MTVPVYNAALHDIGIAGTGWMRYQPPDSKSVNVSEQDAAPSTTRAAEGSGRFDSYQVTSFHAEDDWGGGVGQERVRAGDAFLQGPCLSQYGGLIGPTKKRIQEADGGTTTWYMRRGTTLYGMTAGFIETIGTAGSQARTAGAIQCRPVSSANDYQYWVQLNTGVLELDQWVGSGAPTVVTPPGVLPRVVAPLGRAMWCIGTRQIESSGTLVQSKSRILASANNINLVPDTAPLVGHVLVAAISTEGASSIVAEGDGWVLADSYYGGVESALFLKTVTRSGDTSHNFTFSGNVPCVGTIMEFSGIHPISPFLDSISDVDTSADATINSGTLTADTYGAVIAFYTLNTNDSASSHTNSFTELIDSSFSAATCRSIISYKVQTTSASTAATVTSSPHQALTLGLRPNAITTDLTQVVFLFSRDEGASWEEAFVGDSAGLPIPIAALGSLGRLWWTTDRGLYSLTATEVFNPSTGEQVIEAAVQGPIVEWSVPFTTANVGTWLAMHNGLIYFNVGATMWRYTPGGTGEQVWPNPQWSTITGDVKAIISGEGGIFFSAAGHLFFYDERGFHDLLIEGTAGEFDYLYWHGGKLYTKGDPSYYYDFKYPSSRPDHSHILAATYAPGNYISSRWDADKVDSIKVIKKFILEARWTAATDSGTITMEYAIAENNNTDPGRAGGTASAMTWVSIGTMTVSDGRTKIFDLATPIEALSIYVRLTITPGTTNGVPLLRGWAVHGDAIMPKVDRFVAALAIGTNVANISSDRLYHTSADVKEAADFLRTLRKAETSPRYFTINIKDEIGADQAYVVIPEQLTIEGEGQQGTEGFFELATFAMRRLP